MTRPGVACGARAAAGSVLAEALLGAARKTRLENPSQMAKNTNVLALPACLVD